MAVKLFLPGTRVAAPERPERIALDMAFGVGAGAVLGDKSRYRSHGAITTATWAAGLHGFCLDFVPGNPDYVTILAAHTQLDFTTENFSTVWRVYIDDLTFNRHLFMRSALRTDGWEISFSNTGQFIFRTNQALLTQTTRTNAGTIAAGAWYTFGTSRAGAVGQVFVQGIDTSDIPQAHIDPLTSAEPARIGIFSDLVTAPFDGRIEFLRIFRGIALTPSEHLAWHNALA